MFNCRIGKSTSNVLVHLAGIPVSLRVRAANGKHAKKSNAVEDFINHHEAINHEQTHAFPVDVTDEYRTLWHRKLNFNWPKFGGNNPRRRRTENDNALFHSLPSPLSTLSKLFTPLELVSQVHGVKPSISPRLATPENSLNCWFPFSIGFCDAQ